MKIIKNVTPMAGRAAARPRRRVVIVALMTPDEPSAEELKQRQLDQELADRRALERAETAEEALRHQRRADKAEYLREKLEQRQRAEREAGGDADPPAAA